MRKNHGESGQIIVIMALAIVVLLGFAALAIDVGKVYSDRRYEQSVADAAALAGAQNIQMGIEAAGINTDSGPLCSNTLLPGMMTTATNVAIESAARNHFTIDNDLLSDKHGVSVTCDPSSQQVVVKTMITAETSSSFAHLFFGGKLINSVVAVAWVKAGSNAGGGNSIVAFKPTCEVDSTGKPKGEIWFAGGGHTDHGTGYPLTDHITLIDGGIFTNGCLRANGHQMVEVLTDPPPSTVAAGTIDYCLGTFTQPSSGSVSPNPEVCTGQLPIPRVPRPNCGTKNGTLNDIKVNGSKTVSPSPGWYSGLDMTGGTLNLASGSYCFTGNFKVTGGVLNGPVPYPGADTEGVTIYMEQGEVSISGNAEVNLKAAREKPTSTNPPLKGYLIITAKENACNDQILDDLAGPTQTCISVAGGSGQVYDGTIIAVYGAIDYGGSSSLNCADAAKTQILGWTVKIHGETDMCIKYDGSAFGNTPAGLSMAE